MPRISTALLAALAISAPAFAQVVTPPGPKPERTPAYEPRPAAPRAVRPQPEQVPDVEYLPITKRDDQGRVIPLDAPPEYLALAHNPLLDGRTIAAIAPALYERRLQVEQLVVNNLELMFEIEGGLIEQTRMAEEDSFRAATTRLQVLSQNPDVSRYLYTDLVSSRVMPNRIGLLTQKIMSEYEMDATRDALARPTNDDGASGMDQMVHLVARLSVAEAEFHFQRLMLDTADYFGDIVPQLELEPDKATVMAPVAAIMQGESDLKARAELIRGVLNMLEPETRAQAVRLAISMRPEVDPSALVDPIPADATLKTLDEETRRELLFQLMDGGRVDASALVE